MNISFSSSKKIKELNLELNALKTQLQDASGLIKEIEKGNLGIEVSEQLNGSEMGESLMSMQMHLSKIANEEKERAWVNAGLAKFSDILRNKESHDLKELANNILSNLVKYIGANQGAIFVLEETKDKESFLTMLACYAYDRKKYIDMRIELGEGLVGQCVLEKDTIFLTDIPSNYVHITSGLGAATPKSVLISPLLINEKVFGVLELASFDIIEPHKMEFINRLSENIASSIKNVKDNERTIALLSASQQQTEELRAQEEEMRQNMEEMQATQEEMERKNAEIKKVTAEMTSILHGINTTMATIEFTPDGTVLNANENFLKTMKYSLPEIKGKKHKTFVPTEIAESKEYQSFWFNLAQGQSFSGILKRVNSKGEIIWLNAIYNPILNENKEVVKVVKLASDITSQQEILAENKGLLEGINTTMATIEFSPDGTVVTANENFLNTMKYSLSQITGKHHKIFVPKEIVLSDDYLTFWSNLAAGKPFKGTFKRINSEGKEVWLNAIYNPILNASGTVVKVVKFATDISAEKEN
jgi:PAS domain S-box-containing protein